MNSDAHQSSGLVVDVYRTSRYGDCANGGVGATRGDPPLVGILDERRTFTATADVLPTECAPHGTRRHFLDGEGPTRPHGRATDPRPQLLRERELRRHLRRSTTQARRPLSPLSDRRPSHPRPRRTLNIPASPPWRGRSLFGRKSPGQWLKRVK